MIVAHAAADFELDGFGAGEFDAADVDIDFVIGGEDAVGTGEVDGDFFAQNAAHQLAGGFIQSFAHQIEEALFDVGDRAPEFLAGQFVVGVGGVDFIDEVFEIARVLIEEVGEDAVGEDRDVVGNVFAEDDAFDAVCGAGAEEVLIAGLEEFDGGDFDGRSEVAVEIEDGLRVIGNLGGHVAGGRGEGVAGGEQGGTGCGVAKKTAAMHDYTIYRVGHGKRRRMRGAAVIQFPKEGAPCSPRRKT